MCLSTPSESWIEGTGSGGSAPRGSCAAVRDYFDITPEQFSEWNPSLSLDCEPWLEPVSYCIVTISRLNAASPLILIPGFISCFEEGSLEMKVTTTTDLTIEKCIKTCKSEQWRFAGMHNGDECWCGDYAGKQSEGGYSGIPNMNPESWKRNKTECNVPCSGDKSKFCGGKDLLAIFDTKDHEPYAFLSTMAVNTVVSTKTAVGTTTTTSTGTGTGIVTSTAAVEEAPGASETRASSGAMRNMAVAWSSLLVFSMALFS
ncbi:hypothetical protein SMACR_09546 [Sordaria macrospora]|uniref:WGS project CABT00000000 data, contig 2.31 n=2 Tax=Sordaria macrospora TaxID=5147 RepID=F7W5H7_SORMK|nr:uncharacterized protein SMAC_09546 [Sordaria macrospora k-hell]KAA8633988.1 hypothetical protein SMACR_09546 [Sordaria macrospora]WPJ66181.1 hypothetical protein SMAC4_09546 [Sordaria macrospora]CCC12765.1 unnamed protein product [Sordaria macrospora k-hell]